MQVLVVEDNPIDAQVIKLALKQGGLENEPVVVDDGAPALALLCRQPPFADQPLPELIILDLNLKLVDGPEVLSFVRSRADLAETTVAILSSSPEDVMRSKAGQANCFFRKSSDFATALDLGRRIIECHTRLRGGTAAQSMAGRPH